MCADPIEGVVQLLVLYVEAVAARNPAVGVEHTLGVWTLHLDAGGDGVGATVNGHARALGHVRTIREVLVARPVWRWVRTLRQGLLQSSAVVEGQSVVDPGVVEPQALQRLELDRLLRCEVVRLGAVALEVVELPDVVLELAPSRDGRVDRTRQPA